MILGYGFEPGLPEIVILLGMIAVPILFAVSAVRRQRNNSGSQTETEVAIRPELLFEAENREQPLQDSQQLNGILARTFFVMGVVSLIVFPLLWGGLGFLVALVLFATPVFVYPRRLTEWVQYILCAEVLTVILAMVSGYLEYQFLLNCQNGVYASEEVVVALAEANAQRQGLVSGIQVIVSYASFFLVLKWIYQANSNARALGAKGMKFTPGWAVGYYFIPVLLLWRPYQSMKEIWKASRNPPAWESVKRSPILPVWWTLWLFDFNAQMVNSILAKNVQSVSDSIDLNLMIHLQSVLGILCILALLVIVKGIHQIQAEQAEQVKLLDENIFDATLQELTTPDPEMA